MKKDEVIKDLKTLKTLLNDKVILDLGLRRTKKCFKIERTEENELLTERLSDHFFDLDNMQTRLFILKISSGKENAIFIELTDILENPIDEIIKALQCKN